MRNTSKGLLDFDCQTDLLQFCIRTSENTKSEWRLFYEKLDVKYKAKINAL